MWTLADAFSNLPIKLLLTVRAYPAQHALDFFLFGGIPCLAVGRFQVAEYTPNDVNVVAGEDKLRVHGEVKLTQKSDYVVTSENLPPVKRVDVEQDAMVVIYGRVIFRVSEDKVLGQVNPVDRDVELLRYDAVNAGEQDRVAFLGFQYPANV